MKRIAIKYQCKEKESNDGKSNGFKMFKDETMHEKHLNSHRNQMHSKRHHKITSIYNKIIQRNYKDPLYQTNANQSERNHSHNYKQYQTNPNNNNRLNSSKRKIIDVLVDQLNNLQHQNEDMINRQKDKLKILKRIIEHYNIRYIDVEYYSNIIKKLGLKIGPDISDSFVTKKQIQPRQLKKDYTNLMINSFKCHIKTIKSVTLKNQLQKQPTSGKIQQEQSNERQQQEDENMQVLKNKQYQKNNKIKSNCSSIQVNRLFHSAKLTEMNGNANAIELKLYKLRQFLFLINYSNGIYRELQVEQYKKPFKIYVGGGNNANLIKSLIRRRFWFELTTNLEKANVVWTQLKHTKVYALQQKVNMEPKHYNLENIEIRAISDSYWSKNTKKTKNQSNQRQKNPIYKLIPKSKANEYNNIISYLQQKNKIHFKDRLKYMKQLAVVDDGELLHNHMTVNGVLGNKKALFYVLKKYYELIGLNVFNIIPKTYHIKQGLKDEQFKEFSAEFLQCRKLKKPNYWVMKPGQFSNRGQGIQCTNKLEVIRKRIKTTNINHSSQNEKNTNIKSQFVQNLGSIILQQYITRPLLYNQRKFDIRTYMLLTMINGQIKGYWYQEGYLRTSSFLWSLQTIDDKYVHLTNDAVQQTCEEYGWHQPGNKLSYKELQRYINSLGTKAKGINFQDNICSEMKQIARSSIAASYIFLNQNKLRNNFEIFGMDFMLDDNFKPWLIQINTNPSLQLCCPLLQHIIPNMLENCFRIVIDPLFPPPSNYSCNQKYHIAENALRYNKFQLIFDENRDGKAIQQLYSDANLHVNFDGSSVVSMEDIEEDKEQYEQQGELIDLSELVKI